MPRKYKRVVRPLPVHLEELMTLLEAQEVPDRRAAVKRVEAEHPGDVDHAPLRIDLLAELDEHPQFAERYSRWELGIKMGLADAAVGRALAGKGSAASALKELRGLEGKQTASTGRRVLERHHASRVDAFRKW